MYACVSRTELSLSHLRRDEKRGPGHDDEEPRGQVVHVQVLQLVPGEHDLDAGDAEVAEFAERKDPESTSRSLVIFTGKKALFFGFRTFFLFPSPLTMGYCPSKQKKNQTRKAQRVLTERDRFFFYSVKLH